MNIKIIVLVIVSSLFSCQLDYDKCTITNLTTDTLEIISLDGCYTSHNNNIVLNQNEKITFYFDTISYGDDLFITYKVNSGALIVSPGIDGTYYRNVNFNGSFYQE